MSYWLWAGTRNTYGGQVSVGKLHFVEVEDRDNGTVILGTGKSWRTLCRSYGPRLRTRGYFAVCLPEAVPCKRCWEAWTEQMLVGIDEEVER